MSNGDLEPMVQALGRGGLDEGHVRELVDLVSQFESVSKRYKVFPKGQFSPDGIYLHTVFDRDGLQSLTKLLLEIPRIDSVEVFPRGIIDPDFFSARIGLR